MADNVTFQTTAATPADGTIVAAREVSAGGDTAQVQVMVPVGVTGSEGAYTLREFVIADDAAFTPGTNAVAMVGATFDDTGPDSVDEGDAGALRMSGRRELYVQLRDAAGNERGLNVDASGRIGITDGGGNLSIDDGGNVISVDWNGTAPPIGAGTEAAALRVTLATDSTGVVSVDDNGGALTVDNGGTFAVQIDGDALTALQNADTDLTTIIGHVDGLEGLLTTIDTDTGNIATAASAIQTAVELLDNMIKVEDAASGNAHSGAAVFAVRDDALAADAETSNDGDYTFFRVNNNGALWVKHDGNITADLGATDNAVLDNIDADLTTIIGHVDGIEALLGTIDADTGSILTAVQLIDNIVMLEDAQHQSGDAGVMLLAVRQDAQADFGADGDYVPLSIDADGQLRVNAGTVTASADSEYVDDADWTDSTSVHTLVGGLYQSAPQTVTDGDVAPFNITANGALHTAVQSSALPTGAATAARQDTSNTHLSNMQQTDGASGIAGGFQVVPSGYWFDDDTPSAMTEGDLGGARMSARREVYVQIRDAAGNERGLNVSAAGAIAVTGTVDLGATDNAVLDNIDADLTTIIGHVDGIETLLGTIDADTSGIITAVQLIDDVIYVDDADWSDGTSKHALVGGLYQSSPQTVTDGDVAPFNITVNGALHTSLVTALPAGTNGIGKLTANSGVDIGDVDVTSIVLPRNLIGPGQPGTAVDSYTHAAFNLAAGANQVLVSSAASKQIWVYGIGFTVNVAGTVSFQDEDDTAITGVMQMGATGGMAISPSGNFSMPIWKLATDKDLEVDVVTSELDGWIDYAIISV